MPKYYIHKDTTDDKAGLAERILEVVMFVIAVVGIVGVGVCLLWFGMMEGIDLMLELCDGNFWGGVRW